MRTNELHLNNSKKANKSSKEQQKIKNVLLPSKSRSRHREAIALAAGKMAKTKLQTKGATTPLWLENYTGLSGHPAHLGFPALLTPPKHPQRTISPSRDPLLKTLFELG